MRRLTLLTLVAVVLSVLWTNPPDTAQADDLGYVPGMVIVRFKAQYMPTRAQVSLRSARLGIGELDNLLAAHGATQIKKYLPTFNQETSEAGGRLERTFIIYYQDGTDPADLVNELSQFPCFEEVKVNRRLRRYYGGTWRREPLDERFSDQGNLDNDDDRLDIDAPEAWKIETGDTNVVIGIIDSGTMIDASGDGASKNVYGLDSDMQFYFNDFEDNSPKRAVGGHDLDGTDGDDLDTLGLADNVIGYCHAPKPDAVTDPLDSMFWYSMPHCWIVDESPQNWMTDEAKSGPVVGRMKIYDHGFRVASIAAATATFTGSWPYPNNIAGIANGCKVYVLRDGGEESDEVEATWSILTATDFADVINMSWGFKTNPGGYFEDAIIRAVEKNCVLVAITGNDKVPGTPPDPPDSLSVLWPGRYDDVLAVGNMTETNPGQPGGDPVLDPTSIYGPDVGAVSLVAPVLGQIPANGLELCQAPDTSFIGADCWEECSTTLSAGTSSAAPQVAGVAALIRSRFPGLDQEIVRERILRAAEWYWSETTEDSMKYGHGKLNAYRALTEWGEVTENTTWDASDTRNSTYYVSGDLTVQEGVTLTINPGTVVKIAPDHERDGADPDRVQIVVNGSLQIGPGSGEVVFESFHDSELTDSDWVGIYFGTTSQNNDLDGLVIRNAQVGIESRVALTLDNCTLEQCSTAVKSHANLTVRSSVVRNATDYGIYAAAGSVTLENDTIIGPEPSYSGTGVMLSESVGTSNLDGLVIRNAQVGIESQVTLTLDNCTLEQCSTAVKSHANLTVRSSVIRDATDYGIYAANGSVTLSNDTIVGPEPSYGGTGVWLSEHAEPATVDSCAFRYVEVGISGPTFSVSHSYVSASLLPVHFSGDGSLLGDTLSTQGYGVMVHGDVACRDTWIEGAAGSFVGIYIPASSDSLTLRETAVSGFDTGIYLANDARADIDSCVITDNDIGIEVYDDAYPVIRNSTFDENTTNGIYCHDGSHITIEGNTITNSSVGIYCLDYSDAEIGTENVIEENTTGVKCDDYSDPTIRSNKISINTIGVAALNGADPDLGHACGPNCNPGGCTTEGGNKITSNSSYHVSNLSYWLTVMAECNYWGSKGPKPEQFVGVDYSPYLTSDPLPNLVAERGEGEGDDDEPEEPNVELPATYDVAQNVPNPFNPSTVIRYQVPPPGGDVRIDIYNVRGQVVVTLVREAKAPGYYTLAWDGRNDRGESVATGVYFLYMTADRFSQTRKLVLLK